MERIEKVLREAKLQDKDIARVLLNLEAAVQEEVGRELFNFLPKTKKVKFLKMAKEGKSAQELNKLFDITADQAKQLIEEKLNKSADELEKWTAQLNLAEEEARQKIAEKLLNKASTSEAA